jgi:spermidine/putrescine transport system permease protein
MNARRASVPLTFYYFSLIVLLYLPIAFLFIFSVNSSASLSFPIKQLTLDWYQKLFAADAVLRSARNSILVAIGSSFAATILGTMVSLLMLRYKFRAQSIIVALAVLPLIVPYVVLGVALLILFSVLHIERSLWTIGIAHTVVALPYTLLIIASRLAGFDSHLEEAAMDLGADYPTTLRRVVLPLIFPAMVSAWLAGTQPTFPVYLFSQLRFANRLPIMIALAVLMMIGTLTLVFIAERFRQREA